MAIGNLREQYNAPYRRHKGVMGPSGVITREFAPADFRGRLRRRRFTKYAGWTGAAFEGDLKREFPQGSNAMPAPAEVR